MLNRRLQKISRRLVATCSCTKNSVGDLQSGTPTRPVAVYFQITQDLRQTLRQQVGTQCWSGDVATTVGAGRLPITDALKTVQDCRCFAHETRNFNEIFHSVIYSAWGWQARVPTWRGVTSWRQQLGDQSASSLDSNMSQLVPSCRRLIGD